MTSPPTPSRAGTSAENPGEGAAHPSPRCRIPRRGVFGPACRRCRAQGSPSESRWWREWEGREGEAGSARSVSRRRPRQEAGGLGGAVWERVCTPWTARSTRRGSATRRSDYCRARKCSTCPSRSRSWRGSSTSGRGGCSNSTSNLGRATSSSLTPRGPPSSQGVPHVRLLTPGVLSGSESSRRPERGEGRPGPQPPSPVRDRRKQGKEGKPNIRR